MNLFVLLSMPLITAFIGWLTNKVAIKMLFRPREPINVLGYKWQGLIPRRQEEVAENAGEIIEREFLGKHWIRSEMEKIDLDTPLREFASNLVRERLAKRLRKVPIVSNFITDETIAQIEKIAAEEITKKAKPILKKVAEDFEERIDVKELIREKIVSFDIDKLEDVTHRVASKEFRTIELLGGVLGFLVGLVQLLILYLGGQLA